jgi:aspartate carbamoyltransferase regulatory subunit
MPLTVYYSQETGLPVKARYTISDPTGVQDVETTMTDYRPVDGILYAHRTVQKVGNMETLTVIESIRHDAVMDKQQFDLPEAIRAMVDTRKETSG